MATAIINGRRVQVPPVASVEDIRKAGGHRRRPFRDSPRSRRQLRRAPRRRGGGQRR